MMTRANFVGLSTTFLILLSVLNSCTENPYPQGKAIYEYKCGNCHMNDGSGLVGNIPPLAQADWLQNNREDIVCAIKYGMKGNLTVNGLSYSGIMRGYPELSNTEITNVANYILQAWGNDLPPLKANSIDSMLSNCELQKPIKLANPQQLIVQ